ncbi:hypothetical protein MFLAVUS_007728 [Mucor flavus]|uniref:Uncharacterized protein n=1 Tax=Mucor flavus TaxID=439312 RepID=A0ABP9Z558_9FUNG
MRLIFYTSEIASIILTVADDQKEVVWKDVLLGLSDLIKENYSGKNLKVYKGDWKRKIRAITKELGYKLLEGNGESFEILKLENVADSTTSSESTTNSSYKLSDLEKKRVLDSYDAIPTFCKWILSTGKVIDDTMRQLTEDSIYEHPVHLMILDAEDPIWKKFFTEIELNEIR